MRLHAPSFFYLLTERKHVQSVDAVMALFGDDSVKQPEEFFSTFEQFVAKVTEARTENEQQARKDEEERRKLAATATSKKVRWTGHAP